jgi:hypothetical protein
MAPAIGALAMSASSITVATNAVLLKRVEPQLRAMTRESHSIVGQQQVPAIG